MISRHVAAWAAVLCGVALTASAQVIDFKDTFETYPAGPLPRVNGWFYNTNDVAVITNDTYTYLGSRPSENSGSDFAYMRFADTSITNTLTGDTTNYIVWTDFMLSATRVEETNLQSNVGADAQLAFYFNTNGNMVLYHKGVYFDGTQYEFTNVWTTIRDRYVESNEWVRISIKQDYAYVDAEISLRYFQIYLNGLVITNAMAYIDDTNIVVPFLPDGGSWFPFADASRDHMEQFTAFGSGKLDDIAINTFAPTFAPVVLASVTGHGSITPGGTVVLLYDTNFVIAANQYYCINDVRTNGASVGGAFGPGVTNFGYTWPLAQGGGTLAAQVVAERTNGVPAQWMASHGLTDPNGDADHDGAKNWEEWLAGTDPNVSNSVFKVVIEDQIGGTNHIAWLGSTNGVTLPFLVDRSTNILTGWNFLQSVARGSGMTNVMYDGTARTNTMFFYRVRATNDWSF